MEKTLYECKVEYLHDNGFKGHIKNVNYWYRRIFNNRRGKSAKKRLDEWKEAKLGNKIN